MKSIIQKLGMLVAMLLAILPASAYDFEVDGLYYEILDLQSLTAKVVGCNDRTVKEISIPTTVSYSSRDLSITEIGDGAFAYFNNLETIKFGKNIKKIGDATFNNCESVKEVSFNNGLEIIGNSAFAGCNYLESVFIPSSVSKIGWSAFNSCSLTKWNIENLSSYCQIDFSGSFLTSAHRMIYIENKALSTIEIPDEIEEIKPYAFSNIVNTTITMPGRVRKIGKGAFSRCDLNSISLSQSLDSIMEEAFSYVKVETLSIPSSVSYIKDLGDDMKLNNLNFEAGENPIELEFNLTTNSGTSGSYYSSFCGRSDIEKLSIDRPVLMNGYKGKYNNYEYCLAGGGAFSRLKSLNEVIIGKYCLEITPQWFYGCNNLKKLTIEDGVTPIEFYQNIYYVEHYSNRYPQDELKPKFFSTFENCPLTTIHLGRNIRYTQKFEDSEYANKRTAPFNNKKTLKSVTIGEYVDGFPQSDFFANDNIEFFEVGKSLTEIPNDCLSGNDNISEIAIRSLTPPDYSTGFSNWSYINATLYVPEEAIPSYKAKEPWSNFWNIVDIDGLSSLDNIMGSEQDCIKITSNGFMVEKYVTVSVYGIDGRLYFSSPVEPDQNIQLNPGFYIVKVGDKSVKIKI